MSKVDSRCSNCVLTIISLIRLHLQSFAITVRPNVNAVACINEEIQFDGPIRTLSSSVVARVLDLVLNLKLNNGFEVWPLLEAVARWTDSPHACRLG